MLRAMDSAVSGLRAHQNKLDVIGNNIANVNTYGFKSQNYTFKDAMYQTASSSSGGEATNGAATVGGANPAQYGYGAMTGTITTDMTSSTPTYVGGFNATINGPGYFLTKSSNDTAGITLKANDDAGNSTAIRNGNFSYTRVGQFSIDANGYIVDANKNFVYGFRPTGDLSAVTGYSDNSLVALRAPSESNGTNNFTGTAVQMSSLEIDNDGVVRGTVQNGNDKMTITLGKVAVANFQNQEGLTKAGNNTFVTKAGDNTGLVSAKEPGGANSTLMAGYLEASNVDLAKEFADMITTERGFQANAKLITVSDEVLQELVNMKR
jgi:flagellar hook protein FlgE